MQVTMSCFNCHTPFTLKLDEVEAALTQLHLEDLKHYNASCPRCGKVNKVSKVQLKRAAPGWEPPKQKAA